MLLFEFPDLQYNILLVAIDQSCDAFPRFIEFVHILVAHKSIWRSLRPPLNLLESVDNRSWGNPVGACYTLE